MSKWFIPPEWRVRKPNPVRIIEVPTLPEPTPDRPKTMTCPNCGRSYEEVAQ